MRNGKTGLGIYDGSVLQWLTHCISIAWPVSLAQGIGISEQYYDCYHHGTKICFYVKTQIRRCYYTHGVTELGFISAYFGHDRETDH